MIRSAALVIVVLFLAMECRGQSSSEPIYSSEAFKVYANRVEQEPFHARAVSSTEIFSDYQSPVNQFVKPRIDFKFSINGKDNEMISGKDHHFNCLSGDESCVTPLIVFGEQLNDNRVVPQGVYLKPDTKLKIRLDMRNVFNEFQSKGYYQSFNGSRIFKDDFKGVYVAGGTTPLTWDFDNLHNFKNLQLRDDDGDHIYELDLVLNSKENRKSVVPQWKLSLDTQPFPQYNSDFLIVDALYNLSLEEMIKAVEKDSTLRTGKEWSGVWTRDVSYSIILSMAILQPKVSQYSLMRKVKDGMIIQDTGTGGAYPVSTDRVIWAAAAWEIYKVTGNKEWLRTAYPIIKKSIEADLENALDKETGLMRGESSFLDWREQTYPDWMQPADIYQSLCLGTNAVHYQANMVLSSMAKALGESTVSTKHGQIADKIKRAINEHLWLTDKKYYGQYLYGRTFNVVSPKSEALGEALCVLLGIADPERQKQLVAHTPVNEFGIPCIYPQIPNIPPYHNDAIWPFVQSFWAIASAKASNEQSVLNSLAAIWRPAALFLTNKENFVASTGDFASTQINSDNMLWSLSGNLSMIYKVLFGIQYNEHSITFEPFVPEALKGKRKLSNFRYRDAMLYVKMEGFGNVIKSITMDGKPLQRATIPATLKGVHEIVIILADNSIGGKVNMATNHTTPSAPVLSLNNNKLTWPAIESSVQYKILRNGIMFKEQKDTLLHVGDESFSEFQVIAIDKHGYESFASEPVTFSTASQTSVIEIEKSNLPCGSQYQGFTGDGYVRTNRFENSTVKFQYTASANGVYVVDFRYSNGNGPVNTENKCAIRTLKVNGQVASTVVFPQRGKGEWSDWGFSNSLIVDLDKGSHEFALEYQPHNANMNVETNEALIDFVRIVRIK